MIETSAYVHGEYDWIITFIADDLLQAKKFSQSLFTLYSDSTEKMTILETLMPIRKQYILNPERTKLKDFL